MYIYVNALHGYMAVNPIIVATFVSLFNCSTVGRSSYYMTAPSSICFSGRYLTVSICGRARRGPVCGFLVFWCQIIIESFALLQYSVFDYICFTVFTYELENSYTDRTYINYKHLN